MDLRDLRDKATPVGAGGYGWNITPTERYMSAMMSKSRGVMLGVKSYSFSELQRIVASFASQEVSYG